MKINRTAISQMIDEKVQRYSISSIQPTGHCKHDLLIMGGVWGIIHIYLIPPIATAYTNTRLNRNQRLESITYICYFEALAANAVIFLSYPVNLLTLLVVDSKEFRATASNRSIAQFIPVFILQPVVGGCHTQSETGCSKFIIINYSGQAQTPICLPPRDMVSYYLPSPQGLYMHQQQQEQVLLKQCSPITGPPSSFSRYYPFFWTMLWVFTWFNLFIEDYWVPFSRIKLRCRTSQAADWEAAYPGSATIWKATFLRATRAQRLLPACNRALTFFVFLATDKARTTRLAFALTFCTICATSSARTTLNAFGTRWALTFLAFLAANVPCQRIELFIKHHLFVFRSYYKNKNNLMNIRIQIRQVYFVSLYLLRIAQLIKIID